jgi:hypothetical protein
VVILTGFAHDEERHVVPEIACAGLPLVAAELE